MRGFQKGHEVPEKWKEAVSNAQKGKIESEGTRQKKSDAHKERWKHPTDEMLLNVKKFSNSRKGKTSNEETKRRMRETRKRLNKEGKIKAFGHGIEIPKDTWIGRHHTELSKQKMSKTKQILFVGENNPFYGKKHSDITKEIIGLKAKEKGTLKVLNHDPEFIRKRLKGTMKRPTGLEIHAQQLINKHKLPYTYVGDGSFLIGNKNPDFINIDGQNICLDFRNKDVCLHLQKISLEDYEKQRVEHFAKYGWKCLVFFAGKGNNFLLDENEIIEKIKSV